MDTPQQKKSTSFAGNVLKLSSGTAFAQGLGILVTPIVTRLFTPEDFGVAALFISISAVFGSVACLRYELSIVLPKEDEEAANLFAVSIIAAFVLSVLVGIFIFLFKDFLLISLKLSSLEDYLFLLPIVTFVIGSVSAATYWNSRFTNFGTLSLSKILMSVSNQGIKLSSGFAGYVSGGTLIWSNFLGRLFSCIYLFTILFRTQRGLFVAAIHTREMIAGLKRYKKFPAFNTWTALLNTSTQHLPVWILAFYFTNSTVGYFSLVRSLLGIPMWLIGMSIAQVFFQQAADIYNNGGSLSKLVEQVFEKLLIFGLFPFSLIVIIGEEIFVLFFGLEWTFSGKMAQILTIWVFFQFISSPLSNLFNIFEKQEINLIINVALITLRTFSLIWGGINSDLYFAIILYTISSSLIYLLVIIYLLKVANVCFRSIINKLWKNILISVFFCLIIYEFNMLIEEPIHILLISIAFSFLYYFVFYNARFMDKKE